MKKTYFTAGLALTACLGFAGAALAADVYSPVSAKDAPYVPVYTWTGFYLGANVGAGMGSHSNAGLAPRRT